MSLSSDLGRGLRLPRSERRSQLLAAAQEVFVARGYHAAAMDEIAERAGVSKPVVYQHFPGKLELYLALLDMSCNALVQAVEQALSSTHDNKQRVHNTVAAYFDFVDDEGGAFRLVFESDLTNEAAVRERVEATNEACARLLSKVITEDTGLSDDEGLLLGWGLTGQAQTAARAWLRETNRIAKDVAVDRVASLAWRGIRGFPLSHPKA
jgi:AcrR family transcriptional regulator